MEVNPTDLAFHCFSCLADLLIGLFALCASESSIYLGTTDGLLLRCDHAGQEMASVSLKPKQEEMIRVIELQDNKLISGSNLGKVTDSITQRLNNNRYKHGILKHYNYWGR
jgi:hypothetical protein